MSGNLLWKLKRLRAMGVAEVLYRLEQLAHARMERLGIGLARPGVPQGESGQPWCSEFPRGFTTDVYRSAADTILAGFFDVFAMRGVNIGFPPDWNRDLKTATRAPLIFGKSLDYRDERIVGDIKYFWEPNRHLELLTLAQAWRLTEKACYLEGCRTLLDSWFSQCPYPLGGNWISSLEHSVRLVNWSFAWHLLGGDQSPLFVGDEGKAFRSRWLRSVFEHCHFIAGHFSRYSSANNHLLGEYMGLFVGALTWPMWPESKAWGRMAAQGFEAEALRQNSPDGVNREQAVYYQHEVMDMMLLCGLIGRANGVEFGAPYWERLERLMDFVAAIMDSAGHVPMIGDSDDALMVRFSQEPDWSLYRSLLATGAVMFKRGDLAAKAGRFDCKSRWLLGDAAAESFSALVPPAAQKPQMSFPEGGYYLMGTRFGAPDEIRAMVDCGPLGYLSIAAHGHADVLSFVLSAGGHEFLIDPGTYAYHTQKKWRDYFRGTSAHNTLRVDGLDQSVIGGNFLWLAKAESHCERFVVDPDKQHFSGWHDGYRRLPEPLIHRRQIDFDAQQNCFDIVDVVEGPGLHLIELSWHFSESCRVEVRDGRVTAKNGPVRLTMSMDEPAGLGGPLLHVGREEPPLGWVSRSFDAKEPTTTAVWRGSVEGGARFSTRICLTFAERIV